jgi:hypothetical protein
MLFQHEGFRSLWPAVFFLPWFLLGVAYLVAAMIHGRREVRALSVPVRHSLQIGQTPPVSAPRRRGFLCSRRLAVQLTRSARWTSHTRAMRAMAAERGGRKVRCRRRRRSASAAIRSA